MVGSRAPRAPRAEPPAHVRRARPSGAQQPLRPAAAALATPRAQEPAHEQEKGTELKDPRVSLLLAPHAEDIPEVSPREAKLVRGAQARSLGLIAGATVTAQPDVVPALLGQASDPPGFSLRALGNRGAEAVGGGSVRGTQQGEPRPLQARLEERREGAG